MKVLGIDANGDYIASVSHSEIEKVADKYYASDRPERLKPGQTFDLGAGYDFRRDINSACKQMVDATKQFERAQKSLFDFALMVAAKAAP